MQVSENRNAYTEAQVVEILELMDYDFHEKGYFDKNLFMTIAWDIFEHDKEKDLWYVRQ